MQDLSNIKPETELETCLLKELRDEAQPFNQSLPDDEKLWLGNFIDDIWDAFYDSEYKNAFPKEFAELSPADKETQLIAICQKWNLTLKENL